MFTSLLDHKRADELRTQELRMLSNMNTLLERATESGDNVNIERGEDGMISSIKVIRAAAASHALPAANQQEQTPPPALPQPERIIEPPSFSWLLSHGERNSLIVPVGIEEDTGKVVYFDLINNPHGKVIGASGFGKSCFAASVMDAASKLNDPSIFQLSILDLEHKTSRLFAQNNNIFEAHIGQRRVPIFATSPDEVAQHLRYLKQELDRRTRLSEYDLAREPILQIYLEEMLSLQIEVDEKLLTQMLKDIEVLSIRGRKYGMFLLACSQTDYSTEELKVAQKMFRFRAAAGIDPTAARAAGFVNKDNIKETFVNAEPGRFLIEYPGYSKIIRAADYDVKKKLQLIEGGRLQTVRGLFNEDADIDTENDLNIARTDGEQTLNIVTEQALEAKREQVKYYQEKGWGKIATIEKVWNVKRGANKAYIAACQEYAAIVGLQEAM